MDKAIWLILTVCFLTVNAAGQKNKIIPVSNWISTPVKIDGIPAEWGNPLRFYDNTSKIAYSIANDSMNIYLCFRVSDPAIQMKILKTGLVVGLDTLGKNKQHVSISYPLPGSLFMPQFESGKQPEIGDIRTYFKESVTSLTLSGFKSDNGTSPLQAANGVSVNMDWNQQNDMIYELAIPFRSFRNENLNHGDQDRPFCLILTIPVFKPEKGEDGNDGAMAGGRPPGGGQPTGMGPGGYGPYAVLLEEQKLKQKFLLAASR